MNTTPNPTLPKLYIAGPMTGLPDNNYPAFHAAAKFFRDRGYEVANPAELKPSKPLAEMQWLDWMRLTVQQMMDCDVVVYLPDWMKSRGASAEVKLARGLSFATYSLVMATEILQGAV